MRMPTFSLVFLLFLSVSSAFAQSQLGTGGINGTVNDSRRPFIAAAREESQIRNMCSKSSNASCSGKNN